MTSTCRSHGTAPLVVPPTQNTAPVLEFNCLYTHDLRRKQKRWQDGFLRYHTFNRRIMVYDVPRNFIGDCHWSSAARFEEGVELTLEKGGAFVQVAESVGQTETDLTELLKSARKPKVRPTLSPHAVDANRSIHTGDRNHRNPAPLAQLKHRSLNTLLGQSRPQLGRAVLQSESPYDIRHSRTDVLNHDNRPSKRRRAEMIALKASPKLVGRDQESSFAHKRTVLTPANQNRSKFNQAYSPDLTSSQDTDCLLLAASGDVEINASSPIRKRSLQTIRNDNNNSSRRSMSFSGQDHTKSTAFSCGKTTNNEQIRSDNHHEREESVSKPGPILKISAMTTKRKVLLCRGQVESEQYDTQNATTADSIHANSQQSRLKARLDRLELRRRVNKEASRTKTGTSAKSLTTISDNTLCQSTSEVLGQKNGNAEALICLDNVSTPTSAVALQTRSSELLQDVHSANAVAETVSAASRTGHTNILHRAPPITSQLPAAVEVSMRRHIVTSNPDPFVQSVDTRTTVEKAIAFDAAPSTKSARLMQNNNKKRRTPTKIDLKLDVSASGTSTILLRKPFQAPTKENPKPQAISIAEPDPWSREAFDLFTWRPPDWNEEEWRIMT